MKNNTDAAAFSTYFSEHPDSDFSFSAYDTVIVGSGAAGLAAAGRLYDLGHQNIALITEHMLAGTSRNTGSDKQTYYKLTLAGKEGDSVLDMAKTLYSGGCVDGDLALCEAALSARCFMHLTELGVPFPCNRYGEYIGYKTDHDPRRRATSAGPYTSKLMTEALEADVRNKHITILDHLQAVRILTEQGHVSGLLCLDLSSQVSLNPRFTLISCTNIIFAVGGPAGIYYDSVYPHGHHGSSGIAFEAGAYGKNLTEWQYGLASLHPRWNVSGTYMQALPRFVSVNTDGNDEREFLLDYFTDQKEDMLFKIFLKGYQWPFDVRKVMNGSSMIDILVYMETLKGRRVYLDYTKNPGNGIDFEKLPKEAKEYLERGNACFGTPYDRLMQMNEPAVSFFRDKGVDLKHERLEIALCAQHNNGGLSIDAWWQTNIKGLFCIGEAAASHGIYRPGGTALNAGQVGALRAAQYISQQPVKVPVEPEALFYRDKDQIASILSMTEKVLDGQNSNVIEQITAAQIRMSHTGSAFRDLSTMRKTLSSVEEELSELTETCHVKEVSQLHNFFTLRDILLAQKTYLHAMIDYADVNGHSRGSALYHDPSGTKPAPDFPENFRFTLEDDPCKSAIQEIKYRGQHPIITWRAPRPIPDDDDFFENVWKHYRQNKNVY